MKENNLLIDRNGIKIRPRSEFKNEKEFINQFPKFVSAKLTKRLFMQLPAGLYADCRRAFCSSRFNGVLAPKSERAAQWETVPKDLRQYRCSFYRSKAEFEKQERRFHEINRQMIADRNEKRKMESDKNGLDKRITKARHNQRAGKSFSNGEGPPESDNVPF